ncbi:DUF4231 domain-containing protein [Streptomyces qinzhouensis]|uniref:DUF4231 domain-containing protein n=1 Tax=Streptomyces qinzhouensis TaxID=2599401 RepID=UPI001645B86D|nr:DUF4231 domain-containing protein [Streptomyces qinzhouensis]
MHETGTRRRPASTTPRLLETDTDFATSVEVYVRELIDFYDRRAHRNRRFYRASGVVTILSAAALPLLTILDLPYKNVVISGVGCLVAISTALKEFYRWDTSWVLLRQTETDLTRAYATYASAKATAGGRPDPGAAHELVAQILRIREEESLRFFRNLPSPGEVPPQLQRPATGT